MIVRPCTTAALMVSCGAVFANVVSVLASATGSLPVYDDGRRPLEELAQRLEGRALEGAAGERVLDNPVLPLGGADLAP